MEGIEEWYRKGSMGGLKEKGRNREEKPEGLNGNKKLSLVMIHSNA